MTERGKSTDKNRAQARAYYAKNREAKRAYQRQWKKLNPDKVREQTERYRRKYPEKLREKNTRHSRRRLPAPTRECPLVCEVCGSPPLSRKVLDLDHDHATNKFRGWLCQKCNVALGCVDDSPSRLRALAIYLENN